MSISSRMVSGGNITGKFGWSYLPRLWKTVKVLLINARGREVSGEAIPERNVMPIRVLRVTICMVVSIRSFEVGY
jgi:hypothetical protein